MTPSGKILSEVGAILRHKHRTVRIEEIRLEVQETLWKSFPSLMKLKITIDFAT
jgi:hypothetical protein